MTANDAIPVINTITALLTTIDDLLDSHSFNNMSNEQIEALRATLDLGYRSISILRNRLDAHYIDNPWRALP